MLELIERGGAMSGLVLATIGLVWSGALLRIFAGGRDYRTAASGGWLMLGGVTLIALASATLVPPHTSVLMTVYAGLGPPLLALMGMGGVLLLEGLVQWRNPTPTPRTPIIRWGMMALILGGMGLLMELRAALAVHMEISLRASAAELAAGVERWHALAQNAGAVASLFGLGLWLDGLLAPWFRPTEDP